MTRRTFFLMAAPIAFLIISSVGAGFVYCGPAMPTDMCEKIAPLISWVGGVSIFLAFAFIFAPLFFTFFAVPLLRSLVPPGHALMKGRKELEIEFFFIVKEWASKP